jgi:hypothetical protein
MTSEKRAEQVSGGVFLIGLALLFMGQFPFWPGILLVIGASTLASAVVKRSVWSALNGLVWLFGLAFLFSTGLWWPGILILIGLSMIVGTLGAYDKHRGRDRSWGWGCDNNNADVEVVFNEKLKNDAKRKNDDLILDGQEHLHFYIVDDDDYAQARRG